MKEDKVTFLGSDTYYFVQAGLLDKVDGVGNKTQVTIFYQKHVDFCPLLLLAGETGQISEGEPGSENYGKGPDQK